MSSPRLISSIAIDVIKSNFGIDIDITDLNGIIRFSSHKDTISKSLPEICRYLADPSNGDTEWSSHIIPLNVDNQPYGFAYCHTAPSPGTVESIRLFLTMTAGYEIESTHLDESMNAHSILATRMLANNSAEIGYSIEAHAGRLGYRINHPMAVITAKLMPQFNYCLNMDLGYEIAVDEIKKTIINTLRNHISFNRQDILAFVQNDYFVIIKNIEEINDRKRLYQALRKTAEILDGILSNYRVFKYYIAIGRIVDSYNQVHNSFQDTVETISNATALCLPHPVVRPEDVIFCLFANAMPEELLCSRIDTALCAFYDKSPDLILGLFECFENFINNGFCIANTASAMFLHRNTVKKRLEKIKELTGFDPNGSFYDIFIIFIIYQYYLIKR